MQATLFIYAVGTNGRRRENIQMASLTETSDGGYPMVRLKLHAMDKAICYAPINVKPAGGRRGIGRDFDKSFWPGGRAFEFSCCSGGRDI